MSTLNAKANAAYHELVATVERENPGDVWAGFEHERDAFETGWEAGHEAAQPVVDRDALIERIAYEFLDYPEGLSFVTALDGGILPGRQVAALAADAVLALLNGGAS